MKKILRNSTKTSYENLIGQDEIMKISNYDFQASNMGKLDCRDDATSMILGNIQHPNKFMKANMRPLHSQVTWSWSSVKVSLWGPLAPW